MTHNTGNPARDAGLDQLDTMLADRDAKRAEVQVIRDQRQAVIDAMAPQEAQRRQLGLDIKAKITDLGLPAVETAISAFAKTIPGNRNVTPDGTLTPAE
jgi:hypothetical protein